jgi:hypothetical protein
LAVREIAAEGVHAGRREAIRQRDQQRCVAVPSRAVCQHEKILLARFGAMQKSLHGRFPRFAIDERLCFHVGHNIYRTKTLYSST